MSLETISPFSNYISTFFEQPINNYVVMTLSAVIYYFLLMTLLVYIPHYLNRKLTADIQVRIGPNRVGFVGVVQGLADLLKMFFKQDTRPLYGKPFLYKVSPLLAISMVSLCFLSIPTASGWSYAQQDWSIVFSLLLTVVSTFFIIIGTYASGSQWSALSAYRLVIILISYGIPLCIAASAVFLLTGSGSYQAVVDMQSGAPWHWILFRHPPLIISFIVMFLAFQMWGNLAPFDIGSSMSGLAGGYQVEYSGYRKWLLEYHQDLQSLLSASVLTVMFLGAWHVPFDLSYIGRAAQIVQFMVFIIKVTLLLLVQFWIKGTLPRMRIDQVVFLAWRVLLPASLFGFLLTSIWVGFINKHFGGG